MITKTPDAITMQSNKRSYVLPTGTYDGQSISKRSSVTAIKHDGAAQKWDARSSEETVFIKHVSVTKHHKIITILPRRPRPWTQDAEEPFQDS